jgi:hypothetical protein
LREGNDLEAPAIPMKAETTAIFRDRKQASETHIPKTSGAISFDRCGLTEHAASCDFPTIQHNGLSSGHARR